MHVSPSRPLVQPAPRTTAFGRSCSLAGATLAGSSFSGSSLLGCLPRYNARITYAADSAPVRLLVECRRGRSPPYGRDGGGNRDRSGNGGDNGRGGPLGGGGDNADVARHPYTIKIVTPPTRELGIHCLPPNTQCGETVEIEGESYVVLGVTYRYRLHKGKYTARERQLEVQSRGRYLVNLYLTDMLHKS